MVELCGWLVAYCIAPLAIIGLAYRILGNKEKPDSSLIALAGLGPILLAAIMHLLLFLLPGQPNWIYSGIPSGIAIVLFGLNSRHLQQYFQLIFTKIRGDIHLEDFVLFSATLAGLCLLGYATWLQALSSNDPLKYATVARLIFEAADISGYPFASPHLMGYYAPTSHPPGFPVLLLWHHYWQGSASQLGSARMVPFWYFCQLLIVVFLAARSFGRRSGWLAVGLLVGTPFLLILVQISHVDAVRIWAFSATNILLLQAIKKDDLRWLGSSAIIAAAGMYVHGLGFVAAGLSGSMIIFTPGIKLKKRLRFSALFAVISLAPVSPFYAQNLLQYGTPIRDNLAVREIQSLEYQDHIQVHRGLRSRQDKLVEGGLVAFHDYERFGFTSILALVSSMLFAVRRKKNVAFQGRLAILLFWYSLVLASAYFLNSAMIVKNPRYLMTVQPVAAIIAAYLISNRWNTEVQPNA